MDWNRILGVALIGYGIFTLIARFRAPQMFWKLKPMQGWAGKGPGMVIHVLAYTVLPVVLGLGLLLAWWKFL